ncbi:pectin lyase-like superfamily protein [Striga asiatica]|uniref:Pectin lyase-like superfamily protein n=1 Tax=Striga asiatica TaxID=4170 RepID=A0A5A7PAP2_STRAF|nr:pectin lyase-like superfamily protein [Striga asiatica]
MGPIKGYLTILSPLQKEVSVQHGQVYALVVLKSVENVKFTNIQVLSEKVRIVIDKYYTENTESKIERGASGVAISRVTYDWFKETYTKSVMQRPVPLRTPASVRP